MRYPDHKCINGFEIAQRKASKRHGLSVSGDGDGRVSLVQYSNGQKKGHYWYYENGLLKNEGFFYKNNPDPVPFENDDMKKK